MTPIKPCLWFQADAEAAANFYVSLVPNSKIGSVLRAGPGDAAPAIAIDFILNGSPVTALNGRPEPGFTDAASFMITCDSQKDVDRYWNALTEGGEEGRCGWLKDRYGVSWQIVPKDLPKLLADPKPATAGRVMQAMLGMKKLDVAALERARDAVA